MIGLLTGLVGAQGGRMIGGMVGGRTGAMIGGMVGGMLAGKRLSGRGSGGGLGALGGLLGGNKDKEEAPDLTETDAELLVRAMANSAKSDGHVDQTEIDQIVGELGEVRDEERNFLRQELASPFIPGADLAAQIPRDLAGEAYVVSIMAINPDDGREVSYLKDLARGLGISDDELGELHDRLEIPRI